MLRSSKRLALKSVPPFASTTHVGLIQVLGSMLNDDHRTNLRTRADAVSSSVHRAWMHFQVLTGMQEAASNDPENLLRHPIAFDAIYRTVFDALYVIIGPVTDTTRNVESLHTLVKMARGYPIDRAKVKAVELILASTQIRDGSPLHRLHRWRNQHTAHRTLEASTPEFYAENKLHLAEIEQAIATLDTALSDITQALLGFRYDNRPSTEAIAASCAALLTRYAA
jgi:hypothetical protein